MKRDARFDVLRLVAVILVMFHHLVPQSFPYGFVGVDVFIVIAGYFSTQGVKESSGWSDYINRRVQRIYPELFSILIICTGFALVLLTNQRLRDFGSTLVGAFFSSANVLFAFKKDYTYGYSDASANPLMHLWSLGLEFQFYCLAPFIIWVASRFQRLGMLAGVLISLISYKFFTLSEQHSYYLLLSRIWEFLLGVGLSLGIFGKPIVGDRLNYWLFNLGAGALFLLGLGANQLHSTFNWTLVSVVLTAVVIQYTNTVTLQSNKCAKWLTFFGRETYIVYLCHYPAIAFSKRLDLVFGFNFWASFTVLLPSFCFTVYLGRNLVNSLWRDGKGRLVLIAISAVLLSVGGMLWRGDWSHATQSINGVTPAEITNIGVDYRKDGICNTTRSEYVLRECIRGNGAIKIALIGDSFGAALMSGFGGKDLENRYTVHQFTKNDCPFSENIVVRPNSFCSEFNKKLSIRLQELRPDVVLLQYRWWSYAFRGLNYNINGVSGSIYCIENGCDSGLVPGIDARVINSFAESINRNLHSIGARAILISPTPEYDESIPQAVALLKTRNAAGVDWISLQEREESRRYSQIVYREILKETGLEGFEASSSFNDGSGRFMAYRNGEVYFYDSNHLSHLGARLVWSKLDALLSPK
ncbi:acyltransferase family protein [Paucibacter sp. AS339]|uniref:acyltransferase family protein n=1 Tax=Paucibacter hankyongi TaxID=3133434 RepID=UPI003097FEAA